MSEYTQNFEALKQMFEDSKTKLCEVCTFVAALEEMFEEMDKHIKEREKTNNEEPMFS